MPEANFTATVSGSGLSNSTAAMNAPQAEYGENGTIIGTGGGCPDGWGFSHAVTPSNQYVVIDFRETTEYIQDDMNGPLNPSFIPSDALAYDKKIDDGQADAGNVRTTYAET